MDGRIRLLEIPGLLLETAAWTLIAAGIAAAVLVVGLRARRRTRLVLRAER